MSETEIWASEVGVATDDGRVALILMDYPTRTRLKSWGRATHHPEPTPELLAQLVTAMAPLEPEMPGEPETPLEPELDIEPGEEIEI